MSKLTWGGEGEKRFQNGLDELCLYIRGEQGYDKGVAWNGATSFSEKPSGAEANKFYADNTTYANILSNEEWAGTLEAYNSPDEFDACDGRATLVAGVTVGQQERKTFGLSYRTKYGTDVDSEAGEIYHLVYGCKASPSERQHQTINENPELDNPSWEISSVPVAVPGGKPTSTLEVSSITTDPDRFAAFKAVIQGCDEYDQTKKYAVGDVVEHENKVYVCKTAISTPAAWSAQNWTEVAAAGPRLPLPEEVVRICTK